MPTYNYKALKRGRDVVKGTIEATDSKEARDKIRKMGLVPMDIVDASKGKKLVNNDAKILPMSLNERIEFISTLQILLQSGIPAVESLMFMEVEAAKKKIRDTAKVLRTQVMGGASFADVLARYPNVFGYIMVGLVKAGEEAGELEKTLGRIKELMQKQADIRGKVISTMMYPCFVIVLALVIVLIMLLFVFPTFKEMFENQGKELPWITSTLIALGEYLKTNWWVLIVFFIGLTVFIITIVSWTPTRRILDKVSLKVPLISNMLISANFSNFLSVVQVSYDAGIPVVDCLHLGVITLTNSLLRDKMTESIVKVQQGQQISVAMKMTKVVPRMLLFMISTGEQSGRLGEMLGNAVNYLDKILDDIIDTLTKMIEPIMLLVIGSIVLVLALALYLPLFQSYLQ